MRIERRKDVNIQRVVTKISITVLALWVGGTILTEVGEVMQFTESPFYEGLSLIGWTVGDVPLWNATNYATTCANTTGSASTTAPGLSETCLTDVSGSGILAVVGIIGVASLVMEFVHFRF